MEYRALGFEPQALGFFRSFIVLKTVTMKYTFLLVIPAILAGTACNTGTEKNKPNTDDSFSGFETRFLDQYWKQYPAQAIGIGYGKYYENLVIPDSLAIAGNLTFSKDWIDSLQAQDYIGLSDNNKISFNIIKNQLESDIWYQSVFKSQEWDASSYNLSNECYYIIHQPYSSLDDRLRILSKHLEKADQYYRAGFKMLKQPTRESVGLSLMQNQGGLTIFGNDLADSIKSSHLTAGEKDVLNKNVTRTIKAIHDFADSLNGLRANKKYVFRKFSIGKDLFNEKFKYDLATNLTPEEIYERAKKEKRSITANMVHVSDSLWNTYYKDRPRPRDNLALVQKVIDAISLHHARGEDFYDSLKNQVYELKRFIIAKDLFDFDTTYPIIVRIMPAYERGFALANAEFTPPYQKSGDTYFNIDDVSKYPKEKMESTLREFNNYASQLLSIHEAIPGHCLQGIYNNKKSPDVLRSVFQNGAMVEGWAVYGETMMLENGWGNNSPEMQLMLGKLKLRELGNVIIDYDMQCLNVSRDTIMNLLVKELFQTQSEAEEKYHRATLSQVQLCSYFAGASAILSLREEYRNKMGAQYTLKQFHENFLKYGSSPVKFIRDRMLQ
jgi:uncharacterized protein (DUF885 family)